MGYDQREQSSSSGAAVAIVVAVLIVIVLGILAVGSAALFWVRTARMEEMVTRERVVAELHRAGAEAHLADAEAQREVEETRFGAAPDPRLSFELRLDRDGNARIDGEVIGLDELRAVLAKLKDETSNAFSVQINADPECPVKHVIPVLDACEQVGDIDYRVKLPLSTPAEGND